MQARRKFFPRMRPLSDVVIIDQLHIRKHRMLRMTEVTKALLFMMRMKYLASNVFLRLETLIEKMMENTSFQIITGCSKNLMRNWWWLLAVVRLKFTSAKDHVLSLPLLHGWN